MSAWTRLRDRIVKFLIKLFCSKKQVIETAVEVVVDKAVDAVFDAAAEKLTEKTGEHKD